MVATKSRQIILDTETTGLSVVGGHRIIEIGALEMVNRSLTGKTFHEYINPQREVDAGAVAVHGLDNPFLSKKPLFNEISEAFLAFIQDAELIIHNAPFDLGFLNHELRLLGISQTVERRCSIIDTLTLARKKHPGQKNSLDALCKRYQVNNSSRTLHGALIDAELLAFVYLSMTGGQFNLFSEESQNNQKVHVLTNPEELNISREIKKLNVMKANTQEQIKHEKWLKNMKKSNGNLCVWDELEKEKS